MLIALALLALVIATAIGYAWGRNSSAHGEANTEAPETRGPIADPHVDGAAAIARDRAGAERAAIVHLEELADERRRLFEALAEARAETARYRDLVIDI